MGEDAGRGRLTGRDLAFRAAVFVGAVGCCFVIIMAGMMVMALL